MTGTLEGKVDPSHGRFTGRGLSSYDLAVTYGVTDVDGSQPDCWRLIADHGFDQSRRRDRRPLISEPVEDLRWLGNVTTPHAEAGSP